MHAVLSLQVDLKPVKISVGGTFEPSLDALADRTPHSDLINLPVVKDAHRMDLWYRSRTHLDKLSTSTLDTRTPQRNGPPSNGQEFGRPGPAIAVAARPYRISNS